MNGFSQDFGVTIMVSVRLDSVKWCIGDILEAELAIRGDGGGLGKKPIIRHVHVFLR